MKKVAVVGAGMMGREIAIVYARAGHQVAIVDATMELAQAAKEKQAGILEDTIRVFLKRAAWHLAHRSRDELKTGFLQGSSQSQIKRTLRITTISRKQFRKSMS